MYIRLKLLSHLRTPIESLTVWTGWAISKAPGNSCRRLILRLCSVWISITPIWITSWCRATYIHITTSFVIPTRVIQLKILSLTLIRITPLGIFSKRLRMKLTVCLTQLSLLALMDVPNISLRREEMPIIHFRSFIYTIQ
ncbi:hypothetical protein ES706_04717 [subsurface metagenome]